MYYIYMTYTKTTCPAGPNGSNLKCATCGEGISRGNNCWQRQDGAVAHMSCGFKKPTPQPNARPFLVKPAVSHSACDECGAKIGHEIWCSLVSKKEFQQFRAEMETRTTESVWYLNCKTNGVSRKLRFTMSATADQQDAERYVASNMESFGWPEVAGIEKGVE